MSQTPGQDWRDALCALQPEGYVPEEEALPDPPLGEEPEKTFRREFILSLQRKGRGGKTVTLLRGRGLSSGEADSLLRRLRRELGCGGMLRDGAIELQGDIRARAQRWLEDQGHAVRPGG